MVIKKRLKPYIPLLISLLLGLFLFFLVDDFIVNIIILPFLKVIWFFSLIVESLPQAVLWIGYVFVMLIITLNNLTKGMKTIKTTRSIPRINERAVERWARLLENAQGSRYSKWRLAQELKRLTLKLSSPIDQEEGFGYDISGLELPVEIRAYFEAHHPFNDTIVERLNKKSREADVALDMDPEVVLQYLKERLNL